MLIKSCNGSLGYKSEAYYRSLRNNKKNSTNSLQISERFIHVIMHKLNLQKLVPFTKSDPSHSDKSLVQPSNTFCICYFLTQYTIGNDQQSFCHIQKHQYQQPGPNLSAQRKFQLRPRLLLYSCYVLVVGLVVLIQDSVPKLKIDFLNNHSSDLDKI